MSNWLKEFDAQWDVPQPIEAIAGWERCSDLSWHNDTAPSFGWINEDDAQEWIRLWVNHPDPDQREFDCERYQVIHCFGDVNGVEDTVAHYEGSDVDAAIDCFRKALAARHA